MLRKQKEKVSISSVCLYLKPPYLIEMVAKPYPVGYVVSKSQKFNSHEGNTREHIVRFINSLGALAHDSNL